MMLLQEYNPAWIEDFKALNKQIDEALQNLHVSIEHVGSTSIPNLAAKPIIDIDIVYSKLGAFNEIKMRLEKIGYAHHGNQGIPDRDVFKRKLATKHEVLDSIAHHLYVCPTDSEELQKHILFRDYLQVNEAARIQYQKIKLEIAEEAQQDKKKYAQLKELKARSFIDVILSKAKEDNKQKLI
jgi:GrpB-like predicted nucleotidyltransferase (UPF0157 family)